MANPTPVNRFRGYQVAAAMLIKRLLRDTRDTVTAHAGGGKPSATPLLHGFNRISVCATIGDSVLLPVAYVGAECFVVHDGATAAQVFGQGTDTIDGVVTATGVTLTQAKRCVFVCETAGAWQSFAGAKAT